MSLNGDDDDKVLTYTVGRRGTESWFPPQVMGSLADKKCVQGQRVSGILVKKNFNYHILTPSDLSSEELFLYFHFPQHAQRAHTVAVVESKTST